MNSRLRDLLANHADEISQLWFAEFLHSRFSDAELSFLNDEHTDVTAMLDSFMSEKVDTKELEDFFLTKLHHLESTLDA